MAGSRVFDVVIVGGGPAGCVLANRLSADDRTEIALIEAGPDYGSNWADWPAELLDATGAPTESHPWNYANSDKFGSRTIDLPRARVIGGTTTINGCIWMRGSAADYDQWAELGCAGWSFDELLPYFRRAEADPLGGELHGTAGPVPVTRASQHAVSTVDSAIISSARELGLPWVDDFNGARDQKPGVGPTPRNISGGVRMNSALTYLEQARSRQNLTVLADTMVDRVIIESGRAIGVLTLDGRQILGREIVLSAGAYGSPAILLRSGIGPGDDLAELGIPTQVDLAGVGQNLLDHPITNDLMVAAIGDEFVPRQTTFMPFMIKARSQQATDEIDLHVYQGQSFNDELNRWILWLSVSLEHAVSKGFVRLSSKNPHETLVIDHRHLSDPTDLEAMCDGVEIAHELMKTQPLATMATPLPPFVPSWVDRDGVRAWALANCGTTFHPTSTCKMGVDSDPMAVVDTLGRVRGVSGVRIVDASIFPTGPRANPHFTIVAMAERIAEAMIEEQQH